MTACTETAESARNHLEGVVSTLEDLAAEFSSLARHADRLNLSMPGTRFRHMERELLLIVQQGDALIGAVLSAEKENT